jgi:DNA-binding transcriptional LysR family regulator
MDAADLKVFEAVARLGGMNRAAVELNTVQSNVTIRVRSLEEELRTTLFHRHSRGVTLTGAGQRLLPYATRVKNLLAEARAAVLDDGTPRGLLNIGSLETTAALRLSPILASYVSAFPEVDLVLRTGTTCELVEDVLQNRLDGAFVCGPIDHADLVDEVVFQEELVVLTAPGIRTLDQAIGSGDLKIVVLRAGCSYRQRLEEILAKRGVVGVRRLEFGTLETVLGAVSAGLGVTLLPKSLVGTAWSAERVAVHRLPQAEAKVETLFVRRADGYLPTALTAFLDRIRPASRSTPAAQKLARA